MNDLLEIGSKSVGLLVLAALSAYLLRRSSAAVRHRIWALSFVGLAALPLLALRLPSLTIERPAAWSQGGQRFVQEPPRMNRSATVVVNQPKAIPTPMPTEAPDHNASTPVPAIVLMVWITGAIFLLARLAFQLLSARNWTRLAEDLVFDASFGIPPHTRVLKTRSVDLPMTFGFLRPVILMPMGGVGWPEERVREVLLHESAHVQRGDWPWLVFAKVVEALYWPNPLVAMAARRLRTEAELAADDQVLRAGIPAPHYAATLVAFAEGSRDRSAIAALPFVESGTLKARVASILSEACHRAPLGRKTAIVALLLGAVVILPYAAARVVTGPDIVRTGTFDMGNDGHVEIVAITKMEGGRATSWDVHGALLPRPFPAREKDWDWLNPVHPVPAGATVRYLVYRLDRSDTVSPTFASASGVELNQIAWPSPNDSYGMFQDAVGGQYWVLKLVEPAGSGKVSLTARFGTAPWKLEAYRDYKDGQEVGVFNSAVDLHLSSVKLAKQDQTEATFVLPPEAADQETRVRFLPTDLDNIRLQGAGPQSVFTSQRPEEITRVEVLERPLKTIRLADIPLEPEPNASYVAHPFLPVSVVSADGGKARLPDGSTLRISSLSSAADFPGLTWNGDGKRIKGALPFGDAAVHYPTVKPVNRNDRIIRMWLEKSSGGSYSIAKQTLYDDEGWPLFDANWGVYDGSRVFVGCYASVDRSSPSADITVPIAVGPYKTVERIQRSNSWRFSATKDPGWSGRLRAEFQTETTKNMDLEFLALDSGGKSVAGPSNSATSSIASVSYAWAGDWVDFDLSSRNAQKISVIEVRARPYHWVRFPNVALTPHQN
jgi:beta-lactamase regulating signal transducer with metallopeptidase domain